MEKVPDPEWLRRLEEAVMQVPRLNRSIFIAVRGHDMSFEEIARQTGLSRRQVTKRFWKAFDIIARHLRTYDAQ